MPSLMSVLSENEHNRKNKIADALYETAKRETARRVAENKQRLMLKRIATER